MDTRLSRTIYMLSLAAKLKKNNPEVSKNFMNQNSSYFLNNSDYLIDLSDNNSNINNINNINNNNTNTNTTNPTNNIKTEKEIHDFKKQKILERRKVKDLQNFNNLKVVELNFELNKHKNKN